MTTTTPTLERTDTLSAAKRLLTQHETEAAHGMLAELGNRSPEESNLLGVALLRLGHYKDAVALYRSLIYSSGSVVATSDFPVYFKLNFASALLGDGNLDGFLNFLMETPRDSHPEAERLWASYDAWLQNMGFVSKLLWRLGFHQPEKLPDVPYPAGTVE